MDVIKLFYDLETTGTNPQRHGVHQIAGIIDVNDKTVERFDIKTRPHPEAEILDEALRIGKVTREQILAYPAMWEAYNKLLKILDKYVDRYSKQSKMFLIGYNNLNFDDNFLRVWFEQNNNPYLNAYFFWGSIDCVTLASEYLKERRHAMPSFKLMRVAKELGLVVEENKTHDAFYDVELTRSIYRITTGLDIEI